jgi:hypothetical protein
MKEIYRQFGARTVNPKPALKILPKLFAHSDKTVRAEATAFTLVLYSWLGNALKPSLAELKPLQLKELDEAFATVEPGKATQERFLRSQNPSPDGPPGTSTGTLSPNPPSHRPPSRKTRELTNTLCFSRRRRISPDRCLRPRRTSRHSQKPPPRIPRMDHLGQMERAKSRIRRAFAKRQGPTHQRGELPGNHGDFGAVFEGFEYCGCYSGGAVR